MIRVVIVSLGFLGGTSTGLLLVQIRNLTGRVEALERRI